MIDIFTFHVELIDRKASLTWTLQLWATWAGLDPALPGHHARSSPTSPQHGGQTVTDWLLASSFPDAANPSLNGLDGTLGCRLLR